MAQLRPNLILLCIPFIRTIPIQQHHVHHQVHHHRHPRHRHRSRLLMRMNREVSEEFPLVSSKHFAFFSIDFLIGYGAFGVIWAVTDPRTGRRVALKKMPHVFQSVVAARRAFREIKMLCTFRHENVSKFVDLTMNNR